jgi:hypothetical protein
MFVPCKLQTVKMKSVYEDDSDVRLGEWTHSERNRSTITHTGQHVCSSDTDDPQVIDNFDCTAVVGIPVVYCTGVVERRNVSAAALETVACSWQSAAAVAVRHTDCTRIHTPHTRTCLTTGCVFCIGTSLGASSVNG